MGDSAWEDGASSAGEQARARSVRSEASVRILADVGVNYVQGFGVGRPHPIEQVLG